MQVQGMDASGKKGAAPASLDARAKAEAVIAAALGAAKLEPAPIEKEAAPVTAAAPLEAAGNCASHFNGLDRISTTVGVLTDCPQCEHRLMSMTT